jgi:hypothetical protein
MRPSNRCSYEGTGKGAGTDEDVFEGIVVIGGILYIKPSYLARSLSKRCVDRIYSSCNLRERAKTSRRGGTNQRPFLYPINLANLCSKKYIKIY